MTILFVSSVRGGRDFQHEYDVIVQSLKKYGDVLSEHIGEEVLSKHGETQIDETGIYQKELEALSRCDVVVAEVTQPSIGVGYLIAKAEEQGKRIVALYQGDPTHALSAMVMGNTAVEVHRYTTAKQIPILLETIFS